MKTLGLASSFREAEFTDLISGEKPLQRKCEILHQSYIQLIDLDFIFRSVANNINFKKHYMMDDFFFLL